MEGEDLEQVLPRLSADKQYMLGRKAGAILKKIHSLPVEQADIPQDTKKEKKLAQLSRYEQSQVRMEQNQAVIDFKRVAKESFMADLMAGIIVGIVALPLAIAFVLCFLLIKR